MAAADGSQVLLLRLQLRRFHQDRAAPGYLSVMTIAEGKLPRSKTATQRHALTWFQLHKVARMFLGAGSFYLCHR